MSQTSQEKPFSQKLNEIEEKWQKRWETTNAFKAANPGEPGSEKPKFYCLDMFPYPSGAGLHVGHPMGYIATDILCRYKRMKGFNVLHPMGWDAFGLPAEQYAIQTGIHPAETTDKNIITYKKQIRSLGLSYDWSREVSTCDPNYYKWTQWIFKKLLEHGLAYEAEIAVNWCAALGTVLANDEIIDGKSERGGHPVERRPMRQWMLKITEYADELLEGLNDVDWPESTKEHQRNWIGKSVGAKLSFQIEGHPEKIEVFTTRADTLFGVSFLALAPEHPLALKLATAGQKAAIEKYIQEATRKNDLQRTDLAKDKSGVFTGAYALHPLTGKNVPIWIADYVLITYGTGAVMGVPAHDDRDKEFAQKFSLPVVTVINDDGKLINSSFGELNFNDLPYAEGATQIINALEHKGVGKKTTTYKLRDWVFSRQRYWGEPIPVAHLKGVSGNSRIKPLPDSELPLKLPNVKNYQPSGTGESPLVTVPEWMKTKIEGAEALRESNTMPGSAGSSWYFLRYMDPNNSTEAWSKKAEQYWGQVDLYVGGAEHAVGHLLYSRFWNRFLHKLGLVSHAEPFKKLVHQGMLLAEDGEKMSKSRGNVVNPDQVVKSYGSDTFRLFEMFLGPIEKSKPWQTANIEGVYRFVSRYWRLCVSDDQNSLAAHVQDISETEWPEKLRVAYNKTIKQVSDDIEKLSFNTAIAAMMVLVNEAYEYFNQNKKVPRKIIETLTLVLSPFAPHVSEEIWELLGNKQSLVRHPWPSFDAAQTQSSQIEIPIQVNGKVRERVQVVPDISEADMKELVLSHESVKKWLNGAAPKKFIYVKGRLVSLVV